MAMAPAQTRATGDNEGGSRRRMIEAAIDLMRGSGLSGAGINEIVRASAAPKGSVYHFFPDGKQQLVAEALTDYSGRVARFIDTALSARKAAPDKVKSLFAAFARRVEEGAYVRSCAFGAVCLDLDAELDDLRIVVADAFADWVDLIARHFDFGDARRERSFAAILLTAIEGAYIRARAEQSSRPFTEAGAWLAELATRAGTARPRARRHTPR
jgi:AcrR family transcriptional regulator